MEEKQKQTETIPPETAVAAEDKERTVFCNKFSTAEELEKAYDNLQKEFTKKCQQNSRLNRELEQLKNTDNGAEKNNDEPYFPRPVGRDKETPTVCNGRETKTPAYEAPDWENRVASFLSAYPSAARYSSEIAKALASNGELATREDCLERAYFEALVKADLPLEEIASDDEFLEKYVYANPKVIDRVIEEFLLKNIAADAPMTISSSGRTHVTPPSRPKSIREAGGIVKNMLANRRI